jgi:uncharacterized protein YcgI (DUF1989 family)
MTLGQDLSEKVALCQLDVDFYQRLADARPRHRLVDAAIVTPGTGRGFKLTAGQTIRIIQETGPQIATLAMWNARHPKESLLAGSTWPQEGVYVQPFRRMISELPWRRPLLTCIADSVNARSTHADDYHHHYVGTHCSPELMELRFGIAGLHACRVSLLRAIESLGLGERDLRDSLSLFQKSRVDLVSGRIYNAPSDATAGDYIEFYAEMDMLVAICGCPFGDGVQDPSDPKSLVRPLRVEIYETGVAPKPYPVWKDWRPTWKGNWEPPPGWAD